MHQHTVCDLTFSSWTQTKTQIQKYHMRNNKNCRNPMLRERSWLAKNVFRFKTFNSHLHLSSIPLSVNQPSSKFAELYSLNFSSFWLPLLLGLSFSPASHYLSLSWIDRLLPVFSRLTAQFRDHGVRVTRHLCVCTYCDGLKGSLRPLGSTVAAVLPLPWSLSDCSPDCWLRSRGFAWMNFLLFGFVVILRKKAKFGMAAKVSAFVPVKLFRISRK